MNDGGLEAGSAALGGGPFQTLSYSELVGLCKDCPQPSVVCAHSGLPATRGFLPDAWVDPIATAAVRSTPTS